mgnify:FL=1
MIILPYPCDLKNLAKDKGIPNYSKMKKQELIDAIMENYQSSKKEDIVVPVEVEEIKDESNFKLNGEDEYVEGILELLPDGYGFLRGDNYLSSPKDV